MATSSKKNPPKQDEGNVYLCTWSKQGKKFSIALKNDPSVVAKAETFDEAQENMWELLCERFGDGEAVVEYDRPLPQSEFKKKYGRPEILAVSGNGRLGRLAGDLPIFSAGRCEKCTRQLGERTKHPASFDCLPSSDGAVSFSAIGPVFSDRFLSLLSAKEKRGLRFLPVLGPANRRKQFFELVGEPIAKLVGVPKFPGLLSKRCEKCGAFDFTYLYQNELFQFLALRDLPKPVPSVFVIGAGDDYKLCMTRYRYQELIGKKRTSNICSRQIWVVPDDNFVRTPEDENYPEELYWKPARVKVVYKY